MTSGDVAASPPRLSLSLSLRHSGQQNYYFSYDTIVV